MTSLNWLCHGSVVPACRTEDDYLHALRATKTPSLIMLFGDVNSLPDIAARATEAKRLLLVHLDLLEGVGRDRAGIVYLSKIGVRGIISTKPQMGKLAKQEGMRVIQRMFLVDSESLRTGIHLLKGFKPDAIEALPASTPARVIGELKAAVGLPVMAGGLVGGAADVQQAIANGACAVSTSRRDLWNL